MIKDKKLKFIAANHEVCIWPLCMLGEMLKYHYYKFAGENHRGEMLGEWKNRVNRWAVDLEVYDKNIAEKMFKKVEKNPAWALKVIDKIYKLSGDLNAYSEKVFSADLSEKTNEEILKLYQGYRNEYIKMYIYAWFPNSIEGKLNFFSARLKGMIKSALKIKEKQGKTGEYLSVLISPLKITNREREEIEFYNLVSKIFKNKQSQKLFAEKKVREIKDELPKNFPFIYKLFLKHRAEFCWIPFNYDGPAWDEDYFIKKAKEIINHQNRGSKLIKRKKGALKKLQRRYEEKIDLDKNKKLRRIILIARELMYIKDYRKDALFKSYYHMDKLISEIGKRLSLSIAQVKHILPQEMEYALLNGKYSERELNDRIKYSVLLYKDRKKEIIPRKPIEIFTGEKAMGVVNKKISDEKINIVSHEIKGQAAFLGKAQGNVKIISSSSDISKMKKGDVLVSKSTNPNLMPALKLAAAIITDEGGITCHAAIVSRELGIPCVIGTKVATKVLHDGDVVEVDAERGVVKVLKKVKRGLKK